MAWMQLGEIGFEDVDAELLERMMTATRSRLDSAPGARLPTRDGAELGGGLPREEGQQAAFAREGVPRETGIKDGGVTDFVPTQLPSLWKTPQGGIARLDGVTDISMATVRRRNRSEPHAPAVVIDISVYRAQRRAGFGLGEHYRIHPI
jgi:hypothetical protein